MNLKYLIPAIFFMLLSLLIISGNIYNVIKGNWEIWTLNHWGTVFFHAVTMFVGLYLLTGAMKKAEEE